MPAIGSVNVKVSATNLMTAGIGSAIKTVQGLGTSVVGLTAKFGPLAAGIAAVAGAAGLGALITNSLTAIDETNDLAQAVGISQLELTGYQHAAQLSGADTESLNLAIGKLTRQGISIEALADKMASIQDPTEKAQLAFDVLGKSGAKLIPFLSQGSKAIGELAAEGKALKGVSDIDASKVADAMDAIDRLKASVVGVANSVAVFLAPALQAGADKATQMAAFIRSSLTKITPIVMQVGSAINGVWTFVTDGATMAFTAISDFVGITFAGIATTASSVLGTVLGFFSNFGDNVKTIWDWLNDNWGNLFRDMLNVVGVFATNMLTNMGTLLNAQFRLFVAFQGWVVGLFKKLFSFEVVDAVLTGLIIIGEKIREWAAAAWSTITSIFSRKAPTNALSDFIESAKGDFDAGMKDLNFGATAAKILEEEGAKLKNPLEGFQSSLTSLPTLKLDVPDIQTQTKDAVQTKVIAALPDEQSNIFKKLSEIPGTAALNRGSSEAVSAIFKAMRGGNEDEIAKTAKAQLREATKQSKSLQKIENATPVELVAGTVT